MSHYNNATTSTTYYPFDYFKDGRRRPEKATSCQQQLKSFMVSRLNSTTRRGTMKRSK
jgi:hypothetical protein